MSPESTARPGFQFDEKMGYYKVRFQNNPEVLQDVCIFSSFSFLGTVEDYVFYYLEALKKAGFTIAFVTTSPLDDSCLERLRGYAYLIIERENKCPDFGSWKLGLSFLKWGNGLNSVLLANDSVFGPFFDLSKIIESMAKKYDVWGMTDSYEIDYHIQSYFLHFNKKILLGNIWKQFWEDVDVTLSKQEVINKYEVGLSKIFMKEKIRVGAYASVELVHKSAKHDHKYINPSLGFWKIMIEHYDFPFLKREVFIRIDIHKVYWQRGLYINLGNWRKLIQSRSGYPVNFIENFLTRYYDMLRKHNKNVVLKKRKILFLSHNAEIGGAQRVLLNFLGWLKKNTDIPFETMVCRDGNQQLLPEFTDLSPITLYYKLSDYEKQQLKDRLVDEQVALVFSNTMVNTEIMKFLSFLHTPQIVFVHELSYVLHAFSSITDNIEWLRNNVSHFITCAGVVKENLLQFLKIEKENTSVVHEFIQAPNADLMPTDAIRKKLGIPQHGFVVGMSGTFEWRKSADLLPALAAALCRQQDEIHLVWLGADTGSQLYQQITSDLLKSGLTQRVHLVPKTTESRPYFQLFDIFLMISREDPFPLVNLESGAAGKPVICFQGSGGSEEYVNYGGGQAVPYLDIAAMAEKVFEYCRNRNLLRDGKTRIQEIVQTNFVTEVQAPKILQVIENFYDRQELTLTEQPSVTLMIHIFFDNTWEEIKSSIKHFDNGTNYFLFSISEVCLIKDYIIEDIRNTFRNSYSMITSNVGRDIGSKFALIDLYLSLGIKSDYIVFLHDKQSLHTFVGESWKKNLFKAVDPSYYRLIIDMFKDENIGIVGAREHFINEYDEKTGIFRHNHELSKLYMNKFNIAIRNYEYISGTIYWLRSEIIEKFFTENDPISLRNDLESGNILDLKGGTKVHTWERMFCWMATNYGYSIKGI